MLMDIPDYDDVSLLTSYNDRFNKEYYDTNLRSPVLDNNYNHNLNVLQNKCTVALKLAPCYCTSSSSNELINLFL